MGEFYAMNPSVKSDCSGFSIGTYYCVSTYEGDYPPGFPGWASSSSSPVSSNPLTTSTPTVNGVSTPSPIQTGMVSICDTFYDVQSGDSCYNIADNHGVPLDSFYAWNPAVKTDCSGLQPDEYICVGVKATGTGVTTPYPIQTGMIATCDDFYKIIADDSCVDIANANKIPVASFYVWNPAVKTDCSGLQANEYVCVGVSSS